MAKDTKLNRDIEQYKHKDKSRLNNPQVGMVNGRNDGISAKKTYSYDPHLDPTLIWTGKSENNEISIDTVSIHVHERIDPKSIISQVHRKGINSYEHNQQFSLFDKPFVHRPMREEVSFYEHKNAWANRLIAGDSLIVMNSLLEKEGMAGQVQMVYIDPPYGIKYGSNFQPFTDKRDVKDGKDEDLSSEPETIKAFRDTWELGIHSYLSYLRDRLLLAHELLSDSGSVFVQISNDNLHHIKELVQEIFGADNFIDIIPFWKTTGLQQNFLASVCDYLVWFAKDKKQVKYHQLFLPKVIGGDGADAYRNIELLDGTTRPISKEEIANKSIPSGARLFRTGDLQSQGNPIVKYTFNGTEYLGRWKTNVTGLDALAKAGRIVAGKKTLSYKRYYDDFAVYPITSLWTDTGTGGDYKTYVVQTNDKVISRCLLMTTDPGDLVLDITCGSGTTAYCAEKWGRRWITVDTSRVAIQLAKQRIMTSTFDWYKLAFPEQGIGGGLVYKTVPHITLGSIANNEPPATETLYDQPEVDKSIVRVAGPFTVEAIPAVTVTPVDDLEGIEQQEEVDSSIVRTGETARISDWQDELQKTGVKTRGGEKIDFNRVELLSGTRYIHAEAETLDGKRVLVSFGPDKAPLEQTQVELAIDEAEQLRPKPDIILFAAFQFDPEAAKDIDELKWGDTIILKVQMNTDLLTSDLRKAQSSNESFWLIGQPDVQVEKQDSDFVVKVNGFDYYNPKTGEVEDGQTKNIAMWMLDTDYDGRSIFPTQVFFPMSGSNDGWNKLAKTLKAELNPDLVEKFSGTESIPFSAGQYKRCAIKIIDNRGIESFCIRSLE